MVRGIKNESRSLVNTPMHLSLAATLPEADPHPAAVSVSLLVISLHVVSVSCLFSVCSCLCLRMNVVSFLPTLSFAQYPAQRLLTASPNRFFYKLDGTRG
jgi:hypothetical protein